MSANVRCPACDGENFQPLETVDLAEQHSHYSQDAAVQKQMTVRARIPGDTCRMKKCAACGLEFADPLKAPASEWYDLVYGVLDLYPGKRWEFDHALELMPRGTVLGELGCGSGEFLQQCAARGVKAAGVDFSRDAIEACRKAGLDAQLLDVSVQTPESMTRGDRDFVVAFQVLEHLDNPGSLFDLARGWAKPRGRLLVAVPSNLRPSRHYAERDFLDQPPHHMSRWTEQSLKVIGQRHGWKLRTVAHAPLSFAGRVWYVSTRTRLYRALAKGGALEKIIRIALLPYAVLGALALGGKLAGHAMLADYERAES